MRVSQHAFWYCACFVFAAIAFVINYAQDVNSHHQILKMLSRSGKVTFDASSRAATSIKSVSSAGKHLQSTTTPANVKKPKFNIPALSIPPKTPPHDPMLEKLKKKVIRRNVPEGEDLNEIRRIIKSIKGQVVTVQEFVGLISQYTGDNGHALCTIMAEDLSHFRAMAKHVYETMTQDVGDVLANEQIHLTDYYNERTAISKDKTDRSLREIYRYAENFDFKLYDKNPEGYLDKLFPPPDQGNELHPEEVDTLYRQTVYHRLQWLRAEGIRLGEENAQLQARLRELKTQQRDEQAEAAQRELMAEDRRCQLEETEAALRVKLADVNKTIAKSLVDAEEEIRSSVDTELRESLSHTATSKKSRVRLTKLREKGEPWNVKAAKYLENKMIKKCTESTLGSESAVSIAAKTGAVKKRSRPKVEKELTRPEWRDLSPPRKEESETKQSSPSRYSPSKVNSHQQSFLQSDAARNDATETHRIETSHIMIEETPKPKFQTRPRRVLAPKDSWGGF